MKAKLFAAAILGASFALTACGESPEQPAAPATTGIPGMKISNARMVLAPVKGNPAAVYFDLAYDGDQALALNRAEVKGAKSAMFHDYGEYDFKVQMMEMLPVPLKKGDRIEFKPGGKHLMLFGISPELHAGDSADLTFQFEQGPPVTVTARVIGAADDLGGDHAGH